MAKEAVMGKMKEITVVSALCILFGGVAYHTLQRGWYIGGVVLALSTLPLITARLCRLELTRLIPDMVFGAMDTGLLVIPAIAGGKLFGVLGAIVGTVVGDAITDGIAGFFEGSIAEWLRSKGIEESRLPLSSSLGKMSGCLLGSGLILILVSLIGVRI